MSENIILVKNVKIILLSLRAALVLKAAKQSLIRNTSPILKSNLSKPNSIYQSKHSLDTCFSFLPEIASSPPAGESSQ